MLRLVLLLTAAFAATPLLGAQNLRATQVASGAGRPTSIAFAPGVTDQFYAASKDGRVWVMRNGTYVGTPFLDIRSQVNTAGEGGLLGLTFDPDFETNGYVYVAYTTGASFGASVVSRFEVTGATPDVANDTTEVILSGPHAHTEDRHKGGDLEFGLDGMLYHSIGDGGEFSELAQDITSPLGKIHRFDVRAPFPHAPMDNPFVGTAGAVETIWATGFRNPWRIEIDPTTGDLYVADVGAGDFEEVTRIPAGMAGANGGWPCQEGFMCTGNTACSCPSSAITEPFAVLPHAGTGVCSVIGGVMTTGSSLSGLNGQYLFSEACSGAVYLVDDAAGAANITDLSTQIVDGNGASISFIVDWARAANGDIYFTQHYGPRFWKLESQPGFEIYCQSAPNSTGATAAIDPSGSPSISAASLTLEVHDLPNFSFGYFLISADRDEVPMFGGTGATLCLASPIARWSALVQQSNNMGDVSLTSDLSNLPPTVNVVAGATWHFQYWTRDANPNPTSATSNAVAVTFEP